MRESNLIKYSLFISRNKFDPVKFIQSNNIESHDEFSLRLKKLGVLTPGNEYYQRVKDHIDSLNEITNAEEKIEVVQEKEQDKDVEPDPVVVEPPRKTRRWRARKKS